METQIAGSTIRWTYDDGPTKGTRFEHTFGTDGTVTYRMLDAKSGGDGDGAAASEVPHYEVARVRDDVHAVTYLAPSGWTLTSVLDFRDGALVSVASNEKQLFVQHGRFEVVERASSGPRAR